MYSMCSPSMEKQQPHSLPSSEVRENSATYPVPPKGHKEVTLVSVQKERRRSSDTSDYQTYREKKKKLNYQYEYHKTSDSEEDVENNRSPEKGYFNYGAHSDPEDCSDGRQDGRGSSGRHKKPTVEVTSPKLTKFSQLRKLQRRATVSPVLDHYHKDDPSGEHLPMRTFSVGRKSNEAGGPSTSQINNYTGDTEIEKVNNQNNTSAVQGELEITTNAVEEEVQLPEKFRDVVKEATSLLDQITRKRKGRPWWEKLLVYVRCLWLGGDRPSRRTSKLLFWHIDPRGGEHITSVPRSNGEYIVTVNEMKPEPKQQNSIKAFFSNMQDVALDRDPSFVRLNSPPERQNAPFDKRTTPPLERKNSLPKKKRYPSFHRH